MMSSQLQPSEAPPLDLDDLASRCLGKVELVDRILRRFQETMEGELSALEGALAEADSEEIGRIAHRIKGTSLTISANGLRNCAERLEVAAAEQDSVGPAECVGAVRSEWARLSEFISHFQNESDG